MSQLCAKHNICFPNYETNATLSYIKLESTGTYYDYYLNDPDETPESELLTKVVFPIKL